MNKRLYRFFTPSGDLPGGASVCLANLAEVVRKLGMRNAHTLTRDLPDEAWMYTTKNFHSYRTIARGSVAWATRAQLELLRDKVRGRHIRLLQRIIDRMPENKAAAKPKIVRASNAGDLCAQRREVADSIVYKMLPHPQLEIVAWTGKENIWSTQVKWVEDATGVRCRGIVVIRFDFASDKVRVGDAKLMFPEDQPESLSDEELRGAFIREQQRMEQKAATSKKVLEISRAAAVSRLLLDRMGHLGELTLEGVPCHFNGDWLSTVVRARREGVCYTYLVLILFAPGMDTPDPHTSFGSVAYLPVGHEKIEPHMVEMARQKLNCVQDIDQSLKQTLLEELDHLEYGAQPVAVAKPAVESEGLVLVAQKAALACEQAVPGCEETVIPNVAVAAALGVEPSTLRKHKERHPELLAEGVHVVVTPSHDQRGRVQDTLCWTRTGIITLANRLVRSYRAKTFVDLLLAAKAPTAPPKAQPAAVDLDAVAAQVTQALLPEIAKAQETARQNQAELLILKREAAAAQEQIAPLIAQADAAKTKYLNDKGIPTVREVHYTEDYTGDPVPELYRKWWAPRNIINDLPPGGKEQGPRFMLPAIMAEYGDHGRPDAELLNHWLAHHGLLERKEPIEAWAAALINKNWVWWPSGRMEQLDATTPGRFYWHKWNAVVRRDGNPFGQVRLKHGQKWRFSENAVRFLAELWAGDVKGGNLVELVARYRPSWFRTVKGKEYLARYGLGQSVQAAKDEAESLAVAADAEQA